MPADDIVANSPASPEYRFIFSCLNRIRRRLWLVRLVERATFAIAWGSGVALAFTAAGLLRERYLWGAVAVAILPGAVAVWRGVKQDRVVMFNRRKNTGAAGGNSGVGRARSSVIVSTTTALPCGAPASRIIAPPFFIRLLVVVTVALVAGTIIVCSLPWPHRIPLWAIPAGTLATYLVATVATIRPVNVRSAAIFVDQQMGLQERVATALEFMQSPPASEAESAFRQPVIAAAMDACGSMRTAKVGYARAGGRLYFAGTTGLIAAAALSMLPPLSATARAVRQPYVAVIEKSKKLESILNELEQKKTPDNVEAQKKLQPLNNALADLRKGNMSPFEADARLAQEKGDLQKEQDRMDASEKVEKALDNIKGLDEIAQAGQQVKDAAIKNSNGDASSQTGKQQADQAMKDAAKAVGDKMKNGAMSQDEKNKLADDLKNAADRAKGDDQLQQNLQQASDAAKKGDGEQLAQNLGAAGQRMGEQRAEQQMSGDAVRQAMEAIDRANRESNGGNQQTADAGKGDKSGQQNSGGSPQANSGANPNPQSGEAGGGQQNGQQQSNASQKDGQSQGQNSGQQGAGQSQGGKPGGSQSANAGQETTGGGSTNLHAPSAPGDHNPGHPIGGTTDYVKVYDEKAINSQGKLEHVSGKINPLGAASGTQETLGQADKGDSTIQTYESQLPAARKRAIDDLQTQQIPPQYRDLIRNYYGQ